ncbi:DNA-directed RNA polymerase subunit beta [Neobacillus sp. D3-1R]|uniref:DNA-directed RNA polymerase subunit beta n=1 Tax=Neobacillus sp. D3-1R TaxID=3445778 RepID=UPI003FA11610
MALDQEKVMTREEMKKIRSEEKENTTMNERRKKIRVRLIPVWVKVLIVVILVFASLAAGLMVGYGVIGNGKPFDALQKGTWVHIVDIINKK